MTLRTVFEILLGIAILGLAAFLWNPYGLWMPAAVATMGAALLVAVFGVFATLIWRERAADEREEFQRMRAGRFAFLAGAAILVLGIIIQSFSHAIDPWLVGALAAMVLAKLIARRDGETRF